MKFALQTKLLLAAAIYTATATSLAGQTRPVLVVVNQGDHNISLIDPLKDEQFATVDVGGVTGHEAVVSPDGHTAYVPIYGDSGVGRPGTDGDRIVAIDIPSRKVVAALPFDHGVRPHCILYEPHTGLLYVTTEVDKTITVIDPKTFKIVGSIPTSQAQSHMLVISHDGRFGYTANVGPGTVSVLDMKSRKTLAVIPISTDTQRISISNDDRMVFTADQTRPRLAVIDTATKHIKTWVPLPGLGYGTAATHDGRWLLVAMRSLNQIAVVDLTTLTVARTIDVPATPTEVLIRPDGKRAYISCTGIGKIAVVDLTKWNVEATVNAGKSADGLAWGQ